MHAILLELLAFTPINPGSLSITSKTFTASSDRKQR